MWDRLITCGGLGNPPSRVTENCSGRFPIGRGLSTCPTSENRRGAKRNKDVVVQASAPVRRRLAERSSPSPRKVHNQTEYEADNEHPKKHFRDFAECGNCIAHADERDNQSSYYECKSPTQHSASTVGRSPA